MMEVYRDVRGRLIRRKHEFGAVDADGVRQRFLVGEAVEGESANKGIKLVCVVYREAPEQDGAVQ
jgi:hypothetical protein